MLLWIITPIIRLHVDWRLKPSRELNTHYIIREGHFIIIIHIIMFQMIPGLVVKTPYLRWMELDILNAMGILTTRFPDVCRLLLLRSAITSGALSLIILLSLILVRVVTVSILMMIFLPISFSISPYLF